MRLESALYLLNYHDVSWESSIFLRGLGGTTRPDVFRAHLEQLRAAGELVSIQVGLERWRNGTFERPHFALWFDDGLAGVRRHAAPICAEFGITAGLSVCSDFVERRAFFWRFQLSYLAHADGLPALRSALRRHGYRLGDSILRWSLENFSAEVAESIERVYRRHSHPEFRERARELFDDEAGLRELIAADWLVTNHSASHHPLTERQGRDYLIDQFRAGKALIERLDGDPRYWVIPFEHDDSRARRKLYESVTDEATIVRVQNRPNRSQQSDPILYRYAIWDARRDQPLPFRP